MKIALALVVLSTSIASAGPCAFPTPHVRVLGVPDGKTIDQGGGIVVAVVAEYSSAEGPQSLDKLDWTFGGKAPKVTLLAPAFEVLAPAAPVKGDLVLADGKKTKLAAVKYAESLARLATPAPKVTSIEFRSSTGPRSSSQVVVAQLAAPPPPDTVAVLVYKNGDQKAGKLARGWAHVNVAGDPKMTQVVLSSSSRCSVPVGGGEGAYKTDKVVLVWVDSTGNLSAPSAELTVK